MTISNLFRYNPVTSLLYSLKWKCKARIGYNVKIINQGTIKVLNNSNIRVEVGSKIEVRYGGFLIFKGNTYLGEQTRILVGPKGKFTIGKNFGCTGRSDFDAIQEMVIGDDCTFSVNLQIMDTDHHYIYDMNNQIINKPESINIGNKVWVCCTSTILKGSKIPDNVIIGANSIVTKRNLIKSNYIYGGNPLKEIKSFKEWKS